jgi:hypothetical protein
MATGDLLRKVRSVGSFKYCEDRSVAACVKSTKKIWRYPSAEAMIECVPGTSWTEENSLALSK